jgi:hypothetical protein
VVLVLWALLQQLLWQWLLVEVEVVVVLLLLQQPVLL